MENLEALIAISIGFAAIVISLIVGMIVLVQQGNRHDRRIESVRAEILSEMRAEIRLVGVRVEDRLALDERVRDVERHVAGSGD